MRRATWAAAREEAYVTGHEPLETFEVRVALAVGFPAGTCPICRVATAQGVCLNGHRETCG